MTLIDTHCHIDDPSFDDDREAVIQAANDAAVKWQVVPSIKADWWPRVKAICEQHKELLPAYGLHPMFHQDHQDLDIGQLQIWVEREKPIAIGECGLDFYINNPNREKQLQLFEQQVQLAQRCGLPLIIHARKAVEEVLQIVRHYPGVRGVLHSYSGSLQQAQQLFDQGFLFGFGGPITYSRATRLHEIVRKLPLEAILLETDAPDQPPTGRQGMRNDPTQLPAIAQAIADLREIPIQELQEATSKNAERLFKIPGAAC